MRRPSAAGSSISAAAVCLTIAFVAFFAVVALFAPATNAQRREHAAELRATKGQFFVHMLHSAYFFPQTVYVKWSVSTHGRPSLPHWLHLFPSRHRSIAFLVGTPVSPHSHFAIHVIARRLDSFQSAEQSFSIVTNDDPRFNGSVQEIAEIKLTNVDAEDLIWGIGRDGKLKSLERAIHSTFRGKNVGPFIFNILPGIANPPPPEFFHQLRRRINTGTILQVGTQRHFHPNVQQLARGLQLNPDFCVQHNLIPIDRHFRAEQLVVDWCKFHLRNVTLLKELGEQQQQQQQQETMAGKKPLGNVVKAGPDGTFVVRSSAENETGTAAAAAVAGGSGTANQLVGRQQQQPMPAPPVYYIWESVLVFPLLACLCLLCILCLSFIFFGRREGQHWRDFKTPKQQLEQYLNLRESQRHLREMSQQRQMLAMSRHGTEQNNDRVSIGTFLRPRDDNKRDSQQSQSLVLRHKPEFASRGTLASSTLGGGGRSSIGKQTVAEAARANGSALHLYRHPPAESDEDREASEDEQEAEEGRGSRAMEPVKDSRQWR